MDNNTLSPKPTRKTRVLAFSAVLMILCCTGIVVVSLAISTRLKGQVPTPVAVIPATVTQSLPPTRTPTAIPDISSTPVPPVENTPIPIATATSTETPSAPTTADQLLAADIPQRDLRALAIRLKNDGKDLPAVMAESAPELLLGDTRDFWIADDSGDTPRQFQSTAVLKYITPHTYWWVEEGYSVDENALKESAERFENQTYPTNREFFGSEWSPGVDGDEHLHIFLGNVPGVGGYYASLNEFVPAVNPYSNAAEIFFINLTALQPGNSRFDGVLAHEFQHMIHWWQDRNEETWVNEGLSELATSLNGFDVGRASSIYFRAPDLQLNGWGKTPSESLPNYGYSYLFMRYFLDRFGEDVLKAVVANPLNGISGFDAVLKAEKGLTFDEVFSDFTVANFINNPALGGGKWGYASALPGTPALDTIETQFPVERDGDVHQYGVDYVAIDTQSPFTLEFSGGQSVPVVDNVPFSGDFQWYSNRGDDSDMTLTRAVDLRDVSAATLQYQVWFDIEADWDYAYVEVSTDGGTSWEILQPSLATDTNPSGNAYGPGYTGTSGGWQAQTVDLSPFGGQEVLLRFEMITDDAINQPGLALDDISIPELGFFDDAETLDIGWDARGFVRMENRVPQNFSLQLIDETDSPAIKELPLSGGNSGQWQLPAPNSGRYIFVISAQAAVTTESAPYFYRIIP